MGTPRRAALCAGLLLLAAPTLVAAAERLRVAVTRAESPIRVDGALSESDWQRAEMISGFRLIQVREGEAPSESTEVRTLVNDTHVFFGIRCWNRTPGPIRASLAPRDQILEDDHISVHLDTYRDLRRAYIFGVNPYGVQLDGILDGDAADFTWDSVWDAECTRDSTGWTAEMAIPLRSLRFPAGGDAWGLWFRQQITKNDEVSSWPLYRVSEPGAIMLQAADLTGVQGLRGGGRLAIQPYWASTQGWARTASSSGLSPWSHSHVEEIGADVEYGLTSTLTGNLTINPDYSQVEADALQIVVNQRFPLFYPEKRPFFLEGAEIYTTPLSLVYTRRIADPAAGAKLGGKLGRWRLGMIAVRDQGGGSTEGIGARSDGAAAEPGYFGIGRATYDIGENSNIGLLLTSHIVDPYSGAVCTGSGCFAPSGTRSTVASADAQVRLARPLFLRSQFARSWSRADTLQGVGPTTQASFADYASTTDLWWDDGTRFARISQDYLGSDFRADAGFLERVDVRTVGYEANVTVRPENRWLRSWQPALDGKQVHDTRGVFQERQLDMTLDLELQRQTTIETQVSRIEERWYSRLYDRNRYALGVSNSLWRPLALSFEVDLGDEIFYGDADSTSYLGWQEGYQLGATVRPAPQLTSELSVARSRFTLSRGGPEVFDVWLLGAKTTWQFTRRLYVRLYPQYDTDASHLDVDALVAYVLHPGSVLYVGLHGGLDEVAGRQRFTNRTVFVKASYRFQG